MYKARHLSLVIDLSYLKMAWLLQDSKCEALPMKLSHPRANSYKAITSSRTCTYSTTLAAKISKGHRLGTGIEAWAEMACRDSTDGIFSVPTSIAIWIHTLLWVDHTKTYPSLTHSSALIINNRKKYSSREEAKSIWWHRTQMMLFTTVWYACKLKHRINSKRLWQP